MLRSGVQKYTDRLKNLRDQSIEIASLERNHDYGIADIPFLDDPAKVEAWLISLKNIITKLFAENTPQYKDFFAFASGDIQFAHQVLGIKGILDGIIYDIDNGYIDGIVTEITIDILSDVLLQAKAFQAEGFKDAAAVYARVAIERQLKTIAMSFGVDTSKKAGVINDELKTQGAYPQPKWREIQVWLDVGNASAHGDYSAFSREDVDNMIVGIEKFIKYGT